MKQNKPKNRKPKIKGRGDYTIEDSITDPIKRIEAKINHIEKSVNKKATPKGAATTIGRALGNFVNQGDIGALAGETLAKLFGHGDYTVKSNSLIPHPGQTLPKFSTNRRGTRITEREFIGDVRSGPLSGTSTSFNNVPFRINPLNSNTFPWLSTIAALYDQWEPHGIVFEFVSTSSEYNGANQSLGAVILATDYDMNDSLYANKQQMENSDYACSTKPAVSLMHGIECDPKERPMEILYTSQGLSDPRFSSMGNFQVATQGMSSSGVVLGELWISYDITFYKKQMLPLPNLLPSLCMRATPLVGQGVLSNAVIRKIDRFAVSQIGPKSRVTFGDEITSGRFAFLFASSDWQGEVFSPGLADLNNLVGFLDGGYSCPSPGITGETRMAIYLFDVVGPGAWINFPTKLVRANGVFDLSIAQVPSDFTYG